MNIDELLEKLAERHEALAQSVEPLAHTLSVSQVFIAESALPWRANSDSIFVSSRKPLTREPQVADTA